MFPRESGMRKNILNMGESLIKQSVNRKLRMMLWKFSKKFCKYLCTSFLQKMHFSRVFAHSNDEKCHLNRSIVNKRNSSFLKIPNERNGEKFLLRYTIHD